jgi:hypothetical protein
MKLGLKIIIFNLAIIVGCFLAMLLVPDNTSYFLFFGCCALAFIGLNAGLFMIPRYRHIDRQDTSRGHSSRSIAWWWWVIWAGIVVDFLLKYGKRPFH